MKSTNHKKHLRLLQGLVALATATALSAGAATALTPQIVSRSLTPGDKTNYKLASSLEVSAGLNTVALGTPMYLEAEVNSALPAGDITSVTWALSGKPVGSSAVFTDSPLGTNVPIAELSTRSNFQVASRTQLRPDLTGQYTVTATIVSASAGTTNLSQTFTVGTYTGVKTCALCHSGSVEAPDEYHSWQLTKHSMIFSNGVSGYLGTHYGSGCLSCHTVGYDVNTNAVNGGFDDVAKQLGWTFPTVLVPTNWAALPQALQNLGNIQCENCHGPGSEHAYAFGNTNLANWPRLSMALTPGTCNQCHEAPTHHIKGTEWMNSRHAVTVQETEAGCSRCHSARGFVNYASGLPAVATAYETITCSACHDPHDATNPHQVRTVSAITLMDGFTTITNGATGLLCMNCHMSRRNATNYVETASASHYGPHHGPQADMLVGANAITYGKAIPSSAHKDVVGDACVTCHMQDATTSPAFTHAGGHTFSMKWDTGTNVIEMTDACVQCHGEIAGFDFKRQDYDGNGIVEGVQTEVKGLLSKLAIMLPPVGVPKPNHSNTNLAITSSWTKQQLRAAYDYLFVVEDGSYGIHNLSYTVGILKAAIADLSGDANNDGLADWWQVQYFGSINNPNAAPNATPAGDGIPNWLKFALGLNPTVAGQPMPGGVVWANGTSLGSSSATNTVQIYTAAEVAFNTEVGKSYQLQAISSLDGGWHDVGTPIVGDGKAVSYVTPTRQNVQQYYRVMTLP